MNNKNSVLEYLKSNNELLFDRIVDAFCKAKQIDFMAINQNDIIVLSPQKAFEYAGEEGDKYFKIWMTGNIIAWCTWANSMVDSNFRWNAKARNENKRDNKDILGNEPYISDYLKSNSAIEKCSVVYMFPFEAFSKKKEITIKKKQINEDKTTNVKIKRLVNKLSELATDISEYYAPSLPIPGLGWIFSALEKQEYISNRAEFEDKLMQLKCLDEHNKMIPYFEKKLQEWEYKEAGVFGKIAKVLKNK